MYTDRESEISGNMRCEKKSEGGGGSKLQVEAQNADDSDSVVTCN